MFWFFTNFGLRLVLTVRKKKTEKNRGKNGFLPVFPEASGKKSFMEKNENLTKLESSIVYF